MAEEKDMQIPKSTEEEQQALLYADRVLPETAPAMSKNYGAEHKTGYRFMNKPMAERNHLPLGVRKELDAEDEARVPQAEVRSRLNTEKRQLSYISEHAGLSNFDTPERTAQVIGDKVEAARIVGGDEEAEMVATLNGEYICKFDYKPTSGLVSDTSQKGHFDFLPSADWKPEDDFDTEFGYKHYTEFYNKKKQDNE